MNKATWLLLVSIFADVCILAYPQTSEMPELFKDLETIGITVQEHRLYNKESEPVKFEELRSGYSPKISETYTEPTPLDVLTTTPKNVCTEENENRDALSIHPELGGLRYGGDEMKSSEHGPGPTEGETMKDTGLIPGSGDDVVPIPWQLDHGQDLGESDLVEGQVSNIEPGFGQGLSMDGAPLPSFGQSEDQTPGSGWSTSRAPPSSGGWPEGNGDQGGVQSPDISLGPGIDYSPVESSRVDGWVPGGDSDSSMGRSLVGISGLGMSQGPSWRPSINMRSNAAMHSGPARDLGQNALSSTSRPPQPGGHRSQGRTSVPGVSGEHRRSLVNGTKSGFYGEMEDFMIHPIRKPGVRFHFQDRKPGYSQEDEDESKNESYEKDDLLKYLPKPPTEQPFHGFDPVIREEQVPEYRGGKLPGPGSEGEYPNGYRINYSALMNTEKGPHGGPGQLKMSQQHRGGFPKAGLISPGLDPGNPNALRQGAPSMDDYYNSAMPVNQNNALRMGDPRAMSGGNRMRIPPPGYKPGALSPGMGSAPPPGYKPPGQLPGTGGAPSPGYMQGRLPPSMGAGPPGYMQMGQPSRNEKAFMSDYARGAFPEVGGGPPPGYREENQPPGVGGYLPEYLQRGGIPDMDGISLLQNMQGGQPIMRRSLPPE